MRCPVLRGRGGEFTAAGKWNHLDAIIDSRRLEFGEFLIYNVLHAPTWGRLPTF